MLPSIKTSENPVIRLMQHNRGESLYTSRKIPLTLVYVEECLDKKSMLIREKKLKRGNQAYFEQLILSEKNIAGLLKQQE